ncbi:MAG: hypothetical protein M3R06_09655 [Chloroflexota bacterium]|nr:hypothetical protein [Chloroflexota bacterium]
MEPQRYRLDPEEWFLPVSVISQTLGSLAMTNVFAVVGEHRQQPGRLLLLGDDGRYYACAPSSPMQPVEINPSDDWTVDSDLLPAMNQPMAYRFAARN